MKSPNPSGRPLGLIEKRARVTEALLKDAEQIAEVVSRAAMEKDMNAAALILARAVPVLKNQGERVQFSFDATAPLSQQVESVLQAIADGAVPVDTGKQFIESISALAGVRQVDELQARIEALERRA